MWHLGAETSVSLGFYVIFKCVLDDACIFGCVLLLYHTLYKYCHFIKCRFIVFLKIVLIIFYSPIMLKNLALK